MIDTLSVGDRIRLSGGHDMEPPWLQGQQQRTATITHLIPGQNATPAIVARLDAPISYDQMTGQFVVLELRYSGASWTESNTVHVELCDFEPEPETWKARMKGKWIESRATCEKL